MSHHFLRAACAFFILCSQLASGHAAPARAALPSLHIEDLTWTEIRGALAAGKTTAIYLAGSTEEGGPHMALGKHNVIARYVAERIAAELGNALVYPTMPFAPTGDPEKRTGLMEFPGTIHVSEETFAAVAREVTISAITAGFRNVVLMGEHGGGQKALDNVAAQLDAQWSPRGVHVVYADGAEVDRQIMKYCKDHALPDSAHAGIQDTSKLMFLDSAGKWLRKDKFAPGGDWKHTGVSGDPTRSSAELGRIFLDFEVQAFVAQIRGLLGPPVAGR